MIVWFETRTLVLAVSLVLNLVWNLLVSLYDLA